MTDQEKLERIIRGLECCEDVHTAGPGYAQGCIVCSFKDTAPDGSMGLACIRKLFGENISLLKEQLAHIILKNELTQRMKIPVWLETQNGKVYTGWALTYDAQKGMGITGTRMGITDPSGRVHWLNLEDYGRTWRCWTSLPTDEQRKAVEWR